MDDQQPTAEPGKPSIDQLLTQVIQGAVDRSMQDQSAKIVEAVSDAASAIASSVPFDPPLEWKNARAVERQEALSGDSSVPPDPGGMMRLPQKVAERLGIPREVTREEFSRMINSPEAKPVQYPQSQQSQQSQPADTESPPPNFTPVKYPTNQELRERREKERREQQRASILQNPSVKTEPESKPAPSAAEEWLNDFRSQVAETRQSANDLASDMARTESQSARREQRGLFPGLVRKVALSKNVRKFGRALLGSKGFRRGYQFAKNAAQVIGPRVIGAVTGASAGAAAGGGIGGIVAGGVAGAASGGPIGLGIALVITALSYFAKKITEFADHTAEQLKRFNNLNGPITSAFAQSQAADIFRNRELARSIQTPSAALIRAQQSGKDIRAESDKDWEYLKSSVALMTQHVSNGLSWFKVNFLDYLNLFRGASRILQEIEKRLGIQPPKFVGQIDAAIDVARRNRPLPPLKKVK